MPFLSVTNLARTLDQLKEQNVWIIGTAGDATADLYEADLPDALAWVLGFPGGFAIPGTSSLAHLEENIGAADVALTDEDVELTQETVEGWGVASDGGITVALELELTPELRREGNAPFTLGSFPGHHDAHRVSLTKSATLSSSHDSRASK